MTNINYIELIGFTAAVLTTIAFIPQVYKTWRSKDVSGISLVMFTIFFIGVCLWLIYGFYKDSLSLIVGNGIAIITSSIMIYLKIKYKDTP